MGQGVSYRIELSRSTEVSTIDNRERASEDIKLYTPQHGGQCVAMADGDGCVGRIGS